MRSLSGGGSTVQDINHGGNRTELLERTGCPYEKEASVSSLFKLSHDAINNVWLRCENVDGVHISYCLPALL